MKSYAEVWAPPDLLQAFPPAEAAEILAELISTFQSDTERRIERLRASIAGGDRAAIRSQVHSIKGSAGQMGARAMAAHCLAMEHSLDQASFSQLDADVRELELFFEAATRDMSQYSAGMV